jgi:DnaJ-class molecular chaperone
MTDRPCVCPDCAGRGYKVVRLGVSTHLFRQECWLCQGKGEIDWPPEGGTLPPPSSPN